MKKVILLLTLLTCCVSYGQINMVFRCDDYRMKDDTLQEQILDAFSKHQIPLSVCIIPADTASREVYSLSDSLLQKWRSLKDAGLLDIGLHGFMHLNLNPNYCKWNEFEDLTYDEQVDRFTKGKEMIESHLGRPVNYFVPPRNVINEHTMHALQDCGFEMLSANVANRINRDWGGQYCTPVQQKTLLSLRSSITVATIISITEKPSFCSFMATPLQKGATL